MTLSKQFKSKKKEEVLDHWYTFVENFNTSTDDFYSAFEKELEHRQVPELAISHELFSEGGIASAKRKYLRLKRESLAFDVCAAPFGTSYFFSMRFVEVPQTPWRIVLMLFVVIILGLEISTTFITNQLFHLFDLIRISQFVPLAFVMPIHLGLIFVLVGLFLYLIFSIPKDSYYRLDTRLMYLETIHAVMQQKVAECTSAKGIQLLNIRHHAPLLNTMYQPTAAQIDHVEQPAAPSATTTV